jgi:beta-phosphoglucomutase
VSERWKIIASSLRPLHNNAFPRYQHSHDEAVIFDGEGIVFDSEALWDQAQHEFLGRRGISYDRARIKPLLAGRSLAEGVQILQEIYKFPGLVDELAEERLAIAERLFAQGVTFIPGFPTFHRGIQATYKTCVATTLTTV